MKTFAQIIDDQSNGFIKLVAKAEQNKKYNQVLKSILPNDLALHCNFATIKKDTLALTVDNASWATRLRYAIPDILKSLPLQMEFKDIKKIKYSVEKMIAAPPPLQKKLKRSPENEKIWKEMMEDLSKTNGR